MLRIDKIKTFRSHFILVLICSTLISCHTNQELSSSSDIAFTHVNVVPMDSAYVLEDQTVLIKDGIISEFGPSELMDIPEGVSIIDGENNYLLPGISDFHVHLRSKRELLSYLSYGVTTVLNMGGSEEGTSRIRTYKKMISDGSIIGPQIFTTGAILDGNPPIFSDESVALSTKDEAKSIVAKQKKDGYDFIKVYNNLTNDLLIAITEEADKQGIAVIGHLPRKDGRKQALQSSLKHGLKMIAHGEEYFFTFFYHEVDSLLDKGKVPYPDESEIPYLVQLSKDSKVAVTPNLSFLAMTRMQLDSIKVVHSDPELKYLSRDVIDKWVQGNPINRPNLERWDMREKAKYPFLLKLTKALHDGGVLLLLGTDSSEPGMFPGKSAQIELNELVKAGLTPYEALATGSLNAGKFINKHIPQAEHFGLIKPGYRADLILIDDNPLADVNSVSKLRGVMTSGKWFTIDELKSMRDNTISN